MKYILIFLFTISLIDLQASIYCPPNKSLQCNDDIHYLYLTGKATAIGYPSSMVKYSDVSFQDQCNVGYINRIWYIDLNQDGIYQNTESSCTQVLTLSYIPSNITVTFPIDKIYTCKEEITNDKPTWVSGPCDVMGYNVEDAVFDVATDACYKIFRKFTVMNWCKFKPNDPNWDGSGVWVHTQVIKVIEKTPPAIQDCSNKVVGVEGDCKASLTFKNKAFDDVLCPSDMLSWVVEIDLWGDGTKDYRYGFTESGDYLIKPVANGKEISFTLPERVGGGKHKIYWSVRDQCGNYKTCNTVVETKDLKKPTPYINVFMTTAFQADTSGFKIPARWFNVSSSDNCTPSSKLRYSFSPNVNDSIRTINCTNAGFQFYTIYVTDLAGNYDFAEAFMLVFDNGSCNPIGNFNGTVNETNGKPMKNVDLTLLMNEQIKTVSISKENGSFEYLNESLYDYLSIKPSYEVLDHDRLNIADFKKLQNYILGRDKLVNFEYFAADLNQDSKIKIEDLVFLKNMILGTGQNVNESWKFISNQDTINNVEALTSLNKDFQIMDWRGKINFKAVYNGDISSANQVSVEPRTTFWLSKVVNGTSLDYFLEEDINAEGLQIELDIPNEMLSTIEIKSKYFKSNGSHIVKDDQNGKLKLLVSDGMQLSKNEALFSLTSRNESSFDAIRLSKSFLLIADYQLLILRERPANQTEVSQEIRIFPNPNQGSFQIQGSFDKILNVVNTMGQNLNFIQSNGGFIKIDGKGLVYINLLKDQEVITKKMVILEK